MGVGDAAALIDGAEDVDLVLPPADLGLSGRVIASSLRSRAGPGRRDEAQAASGAPGPQEPDRSDEHHPCRRRSPRTPGRIVNRLLFATTCSRP